MSRAGSQDTAILISIVVVVLNFSIF